MWIGSRGLKALANTKVTVFGSHWCVNIDGHNFSLTTDNGGADGTIIIEETDDKKDY